jgi:hypothetical protein
LFSPTNDFGWTPDAYDEAVTAISRTERLDLDGFIGSSFAARRLTYLHDSAPAWAALVNPAPLRETGQAYLAGRKQAATAGLASRCPGCPSVSGTLSRIGRAARDLNAQPQAVDGRSVPLTGVDLGAAVLAAAYRPASEVHGAVQALLTVGRPKSNSAIGLAADSVWTRYGVDSISPGYLAYLSEVCPTYPGAGHPLPAADPVSGFLSAFHAPCASADQAAVERYRSHLNGRTRICVTSITHDPVTTPDAASTWRGQPATTVLAPTPGTDHSSWSGLARCLTPLGLSTEPQG